jgi:hypothetical protein
MRRLLTGTAIAALALALTASAEAGRGGRGGGTSHHGQPTYYTGRYVNYGHRPNFYSANFTGRRFGSRWCFYGRYGHYWSRTCWSRKCGCYCYWCPTTCCWYYWCGPQGCYYPVSCYAQYPPVVTAATASATATATASAAAGAGGPTAGPDGEPLGP